MKGQTPNWEGVFQGFKAAVDWPVVYFLPELIERYPKAKIILTERDANAWYESARRTIFKAIRNVENGWIPKHQELGYEVIVNKTFNGKIDEKDSAIAIYEKHIKWVKTHVPGERLICFNISEGWKGLCGPLGLPIPKKPFPHVNTATEFENRFIASPGNQS